MSDEERRKKEEIVGVFSRAAATYGRTGPNVFAHFGRRLVELAHIAVGAAVLDVGAGRGAVLFPAADHAGPRGRVVGIDLASGMVRETAQEIRDAEWKTIELREMDAEQLEFPDASFDYVLCGFSLWFFPRPRQALAEFFRVLKPRGRVVISTWAREGPFPAWHARMLREHLPSPPDNAPEASRFDSPPVLKAALQQAGFEGIEITAEASEFIYAHDEEWWLSLWSHGMRRYLEKMDESALEKVKSDFLQKAEVFRRQDGIHTLFRALIAAANKPH